MPFLKKKIDLKHIFQYNLHRRDTSRKATLNEESCGHPGIVSAFYELGHENMNRRKGRRYPLFAAASIRDKSGKAGFPTETMVAVANISQTGIGIYSYIPFPRGISVSIRITFKGLEGTEQTDTVEGKIVWTEQKDQLHFAGIFLDEELSPSKQPFLFDYFNSIITKE